MMTIIKKKKCLNPQCKSKVKTVKETAKYIVFECPTCGISWDEPRDLDNSDK